MSSAPSNKFLPSPKTVIDVCLAVASQNLFGVAKGPIHLIQAGLINQVEELGWRVVFDGHHQFEFPHPMASKLLQQLIPLSIRDVHPSRGGEVLCSLHRSARVLHPPCTLMQRWGTSPLRLAETIP
ncbi:hypothetical protein BDR07DRAFT_1493640 [Suillus spraguei]|nr:hypothetical protein BDR07DRAFT_1493640 [Suillus spraguei]